MSPRTKKKLDVSLIGACGGAGIVAYHLSLGGPLSRPDFFKGVAEMAGGAMAFALAFVIAAIVYDSLKI